MIGISRSRRSPTPRRRPPASPARGAHTCRGGGAPPPPPASERDHHRVDDILAVEWPTSPAEAAFSGLAGDIVRAIEPHSEADPVAVLVQVLIAFGGMVGG